MNAILRSLISSNVDLKNFSPAGLSFHIPVELEIGSADSYGADIFQIEICSIDWLMINSNLLGDLSIDAPVSWANRPFPLVNRYSYDEVVFFLQDFLSQIEGATWRDLAEEINKFALWEFDGYRG